jgi:hypothetical protein
MTLIRPQFAKGLAIVAALAAVGAGAFYGYYFAVREGWLRYNKYDRREQGTIRAGDHAPDLALAAYDGSTVRLAHLWAEKPLVLVFGSCT